MPTSLIAPIVGAGVSFGLSKLSGDGGSGTESLQNFSPTGINAGGLNTTFSGGNIGITPSAERLGLVGNIASTFGRQADQFGNLLGRVAPGISELRASRLAEIERARTSAVGNLRENLSRRRVLGSSFGQDAITRAEAEFGKLKEKTAAESFLQEIEMTNQIMQQEFTARRGQFQTNLDELNLEANIATGLAGKATDVLGKNSQIEAMLNAQSQQLSGKFFGQLSQPIADAAGNAAGKFFQMPTFNF